jgi:hypothetical protein
MINESSYDSSHKSRINLGASFLENICGFVHLKS